MATTVDRSSFQSLLDAASECNSPHIDVGPLLGLDRPLRVGVDDVASALFSHELPSFSIELSNGTDVKVSHVDGGALVTWEGNF
jgi:hypothetical protein